MSSRNLLLSPEERKSAALISQVLFRARELSSTNTMTIEELKNFVIDTINQNPHLKVEYFEIADANTLLPIENWYEADKKIGLIAAYCGQIRLIDNVEFN